MKSIRKSNESDTYLMLNRIIEKEIAALKVYANKPDSKEIVIDIKNKHIQELLEVSNNMCQLEFFKIWQLFEAEYYVAKLRDPKINSFIIKVKSIDEKDNPFHFTFKLGEIYD